MPGGFVVDHLRLGDLADKLRWLDSQLVGTGAEFAPLLATLSDQGLRGAVDRFATNWSHERARLEATLEKAATLAGEAAALYGDADAASAGLFEARG